jgi:hypothetical protein
MLAEPTTRLKPPTRTVAVTTVAAVVVAVVAGWIAPSPTVSAAQAPDQAAQSRLAFEVASIRPRKESFRFADMQTFPGGRLEATNATVRDLIHFAYGFRPPGLFWTVVDGGPSWAATDTFDVSARAAEDHGIPPAWSTPLALETVSTHPYK